MNISEAIQARTILKPHIYRTSWSKKERIPLAVLPAPIPAEACYFGAPVDEPPLDYSPDKCLYIDMSGAPSWHQVILGAEDLVANDWAVGGEEL